MKLIKIKISYYKTITGCTDMYEGADKFDFMNGIEYIPTRKLSEEENETGCFIFSIIDKQKYLLAKIKYGI